MVLTHSFPTDGEYVFQVVTSAGSGNNVLYEDLDVSIDGEPAALIKLEENGGNATTHQTEPIFVRAGQHRVSAAFVNLVEGPYEDRFGPPASSAAGRGGVGSTALTNLDELWITGPNRASGVSETASRRKVFSCYPKSPAEERSCAQAILRGLASQAHRRPEPDAAVAELMKLYDEAAAKDGFEVGVRTGLQAILVSPEFLFRLERVPADARPGEAYRLDQVDLATRLSFFLWSTAPDEQLLKAASSGQLAKPAVLEREVRRMLKDPRAEALAERFAYQWLRLQDVGEVWPRPDFYPSFSKQLADAMVRETELVFQHLVQEDKSFLELFNADYTFLNERLARHYGIDGVVGDEFRQVRYPAGDQRRGIFGHGSMLQLTSMSDRTSPVLRGKWVMEVLMGTPPPPPPPNVPAFEASPNAAGGRRLTTRERMEAHRASPVCNSCHRFIDPIGLALDNFDPVGQWRIRENMTPLDTRGEFYDGTPVTNPSELAAVLLKRPVPLARNFTDHLLSYALGRPTSYLDQPAIRAIVRAAEPNGYRVSSLILGVVKSDAFQMRQAPTTAN
jgi:hypothetical protein